MSVLQDAAKVRGTDAAATQRVSLVMNSFQPLEIVEGVWMVPTNQRPPDERAVNLRMEPGAAFGNGSHPTTRMCLGWLRDLSAGWGGGRPPPLLCDYGSGTGLLAIGALKFGAGFAVCTDVEPDSVAACEENAELNGVGSDLAAFLVEGTVSDKRARDTGDAELTRTCPLEVGKLGRAGGHPRHRRAGQLRRYR